PLDVRRQLLGRVDAVRFHRHDAEGSARAGCVMVAFVTRNRVTFNRAPPAAPNRARSDGRCTTLLIAISTRW
ncbi:MAG TPA: hypothetical protein VF997_07480, partial [Polyangia bacterium]